MVYLIMGIPVTPASMGRLFKAPRMAVGRLTPYMHGITLGLP